MAVIIVIVGDEESRSDIECLSELLSVNIVSGVVFVGVVARSKAFSQPSECPHFLQ